MTTDFADFQAGTRPNPVHVRKVSGGAVFEIETRLEGMQVANLAAPRQLAESERGLLLRHRPDLDEDLSICGLLAAEVQFHDRAAHCRKPS